eukprot:m.48610 g.48610  ORF g.48610 m.48610 type:complete len:263 (+) comp15924_c0_seq1:128-916(+)
MGLGRLLSKHYVGGDCERFFPYHDAASNRGTQGQRPILRPQFSVRARRTRRVLPRAERYSAEALPNPTSLDGRQPNNVGKWAIHCVERGSGEHFRDDRSLGQNIVVMHARGKGVMAVGVKQAKIFNMNSSLHGQQGIYMTSALDSEISGVSVTNTGCAAIRAHGGDANTLTPGNLIVNNNHVSQFALWKRTYQAGIHWNGVANTYSNNVVTDGPHNCFLGGGNEADANISLAAVDNVFDGNTLDRCSYEAADTGAFCSSATE